MNIDEEDLPPLLVDADSNPDCMVDDKRVRVPITIITGEILGFFFSAYLADSYNRLSRRWEVHLAQLYPECATWEENCCDFEWHVTISERLKFLIDRAYFLGLEFGDC